MAKLPIFVSGLALVVPTLQGCASQATGASDKTPISAVRKRGKSERKQQRNESGRMRFQKQADPPSRVAFAPRIYRPHAGSSGTPCSMSRPR